MKKAFLKTTIILFTFFMRCIGRLPFKGCRISGLRYLAQRSLEKGRLEKAERQAKELLALTPEFSDGFLDGNAIHDSNIILGKISLKAENLEKAKFYLLQAGRTPGSPQLNSFGPNMSLAKELLVLGNTEIVLEYFELCRRFWNSVALDRWAQEISEGKLPEFKGNLLY
jgi:tetratricopeptide (TPR) repeat protein